MKNRLNILSSLACWIVAVTLAVVFTGYTPSSASSAEIKSPPLQWFKGNTHTHSFWSDGKGYPEMIVEWYKDNGYHFLTLSDHNVLSQGRKWVELKGVHIDAGLFEAYLKHFGDDWVETKVIDGKKSVRLKPLNEFRHLYEEPGRFMLIQGEEITPKGGHVNAINTIEPIGRPTGETIREKLEKGIAAVIEQEERYGQEMLAHVNHPNWQWYVTIEDIMHLTGEDFFELYNGGDGAYGLCGDPNHPGQERMWDIIVAMRLGVLDMPVMYGLATDDAHMYHKIGPNEYNPGRDWIMVRAKYLTPEHIIKAMEAGDFYASAGVSLKDIKFDGKTVTIEIDPEPGISYQTQFIGTLKGFDPESKVRLDKDGKDLKSSKVYSQDIGKILKTVKGTNASYTLNGSELYVRAKIISDKPKENSSIPGMTETAWTQPVVPAQ